MTDLTHEPGVSRRNFLKGAMLTAVAATATGAGAAILSRQPAVVPPAIAEAAKVATSVPPTSAPTVAAIAQATSSTPVQVQELLANLAGSQAENMRLQAELDGLRRDLEAANAANTEQQTARDALSLELENANGRIGILGGLVALYEQLDDIDMGEMLEQGLGSVSTGFAELFDLTPSLSEGIQTGELALADVEAHIPLLDNGRQWLDAQVNKVEGFYGDVEEVLRNAVEAVGNFLENVEKWFTGIKRWLPFGIGEKAVGVMGSITTLIAETPNTVSGLNTNIAQPLDVWLAREDDEPVLQRKLIKPLREQVLTRATETLAKTESVKGTYQTAVVNPIQVALANRKSARDAIAAYRNQHQV